MWRLVSEMLYFGVVNTSAFNIQVPKLASGSIMGGLISKFDIAITCTFTEYLLF